ncbi:MAG: SPFH domain-containing protein [Candidatus Brocadiia bacterium]
MLFLVITVFLACAAMIVYVIIQNAPRQTWTDGDIALHILPTMLVIALNILMCIGFFIVNPNDSRVLVLFGSYRGSVTANGFFWTNPFTIKHNLTLRIRNFESQKLKVNDKNGNPVEISAVVVWRVNNTAEAMFDVQDYEKYVVVQSESALRQLATHYYYDTVEEGVHSLRGNPEEVGMKLKEMLDDRLEAAGVQVLEARLNHLAYAQEVAAAMLQRQQADAIIAARTKIVSAAVGMVEMALTKLKEDGVVHLDEERKAAMVSNMLVVLCSHHGASPVVNAGTLYQ